MRKEILVLLLIFLLICITESGKKEMRDCSKKMCRKRKTSCRCWGCCWARGCKKGGKCRGKRCMCNGCQDDVTTTVAMTTTNGDDDDGDVTTIDPYG